jgi:DNA-binding LacI/PurR family transcriptional regulator
MDRDMAPFPSRSKYDLVGVDNLHIGYVMTQHLIDHGCVDLRFVTRPLSAPTVRLRGMGYEEALRGAGLKPKPDGANTINVGNVEDIEFLRQIVHGKEPIGLVCENDTTAARVMHHLCEMGYDIPGQVRVVGIDDVKYAKFLRVPLTTYRQPLRDIAAVAIEMMLSRVSNPKTAPHTVHLDGQLVVRRSCGCP